MSRQAATVTSTGPYPATVATTPVVQQPLAPTMTTGTTMPHGTTATMPYDSSLPHGVSAGTPGTSGLPAGERVAEKMPTTAEMHNALEVTKKHLLDSKYDSDINSTGRKIIDDTARVIDSTQRMLIDKNKGEKLQRMVVEGTRAGDKLAKGHKHHVRNVQDDTINSLNTDRLRALGREVLSTARLAGMELLSSSSFRASLLDFLQLASDVFSHPGETEVVSSTARPTHMQEKEQHLSHHTSKDAVKKHHKRERKHPTTTGATMPVGTGMAPPTMATGPSMGTSTGSRYGKVHFLNDTHATGSSSMMAPGQVQGQAYPPAPYEETGMGPSTAYPSAPSTSGSMGMGMTGTEKSLHPQDQLTNLSEAQINALYDRFMDIMRTVARRERSRRVFTGLFDILDFLGSQVDSNVTPGHQVGGERHHLGHLARRARVQHVAVGQGDLRGVHRQRVARPVPAEVQAHRAHPEEGPRVEELLPRAPQVHDRHPQEPRPARR
jgi:hypothetical protein